MENRDFIITSLQSWDIEIGSTIKNLALEISKNNRVLYINTPMDYSTWLRGGNKPSYVHRKNVIKKRTPSIRQINKNMWVIDCPFLAFPVNHLPGSKVFDFVNKINNTRIADRILEVVQQFQFKNYIHIIDTDIYRSFYLKELINPSLSIYYCRDYIFNDPYWKKNGPRLESILARKSDLVITNSSLFIERFIADNPNTFAAETGVNLSLYDASRTWDIPQDILPIDHPRIGYVGFISSKRLDCELIYQVAKERPQYNFVMVGFEDEHFSSHAIHQLPNVQFPGKKQVEELPGYINSFDVCLNFQLVNEITDGNYPLKIDEYLAMGKPVVATSTHTMREIFSQHVYLPTNVEEYLLYIDKALTETTNEDLKAERIRFAKTHSWSNSVNKIYSFISKVEQQV